MKKIFFILLLLVLAGISVPKTLAGDLTNRFCDFTPSGAVSGNVTLASDCSIYESFNGVSIGNLTVNGGHITLHRTLTFDPGKQINITNGGVIWINTGGTIQQAKLCIKDADNDHYADTVALTTDPSTGLAFNPTLAAPLSQIDYATANKTTNLCPAGYNLRDSMNDLSLVDADTASTNVAAQSTPDSELLRLGFTIAGVNYTYAAAGDIQIVNKNLLICTGASCPATTFTNPTTGNIYTAGDVGIGTTSPGSDVAWAIPALDISGSRGTAIIRTTNAAGIATLRMTGPGAASVDDWHINMAAGAASTLAFNAKAGSVPNVLVLKNDGNVDIANGLLVNSQNATYQVKIGQDRYGAAANIRVTPNLHLNSPGGMIYLNWDGGGTPAVIFGNAAAGELSRINTSGQFTGYSYTAGNATSATNQSGGSVNATTGNFSSELDLTGGTGTGYSTAPIEVRTTLTPRIAFHWPGVVASQLGMDSAGIIRTYDNPGTGYAGFAASTGYFSGTVSITGTNALNFNTYGGGWFMQDGTWIRSTNAKSIWLGGGLLGSDGGLTVGYGGAGSPAGGAIIAGNVGIGTAGPLSTLSVGGVGIAGAAIYGTGSYYGVYGNSPTFAVRGVGGTYGVYGSGDTYGVYGQGGTYGVTGTGTYAGVYGVTSGTFGVLGVNNAAGVGVEAINYGTGYGVYCQATAANKCGGNQNWYNAASDRRLKENIIPIKDALEKVMNLEGVSYNLKSDHTKTVQIGFIAQDVLPYVPEVIGHDSKTDMYGITLAPLTALLVNAVKEQQVQIVSLQSITTDFINNFKAGLIETKKLLVDGVDILKKLNELSDKSDKQQLTIDSQQKQIDDLKKSIEEIKNNK